MAVGAVRNQEAPTFRAIQIEPEDGRVGEIARGAIQPQESGIKWVWSVFIDCIGGSLNGVTYLFFRVLSVFKPEIAPQVEIVWVRLECIWVRLKSRLKEENLQQNFARLGAENARLSERVQLLERENGKLTREKREAILAKDQVLDQKDLVQAKAEGLQAVVEQLTHRVVALTHDNEFFGEENARLGEKGHLAEVQVGALGSQVALLKKMNKKAVGRADASDERAQVAESEKGTALLALHIAQNGLAAALRENSLQDFKESLVQIEAERVKALVRIGEIYQVGGVNHEFDVGVENLLPNLQKQSAAALVSIESAMEKLPPHHESRIHFETLSFALNTWGESLVGLGEAFALHSSFGSMISQAREEAHPLKPNLTYYA